VQSTGHGQRSGVEGGSTFGKTRYTWGTTPTDRRFTGQRSDSYINLYQLLMAPPPKRATKLLKALQQAGIDSAAVIGEIIPGSKGRIRVSA